MTSRALVRSVPTSVTPRQRRLSLLAAAVLMLAPWLAACGQSTDTSKSKDSGSVVVRAPDPNDPVIAKVNGAEIRQSDLAMAEEDLGQNLAQLSTEEKRNALIDYLTNIILVAQTAESKKVGDSSDFQRRLVHIRNKLLAEFMLHAEVQAAVTEEVMHKTYDQEVDKMGKISDEQEVRARHILIRVADPNDEKASKEAEDKIKSVIERLNKGEDFVQVANEVTEDPSGKQNGGDLDYFTKDQMVPEFSSVAFKLEKGQISEPIKTQFGWHVLKVEDKRNLQPPEFDRVRNQIRTIVMRKAQAEFIDKLRADAKIELLDKPAEKK